MAHGGARGRGSRRGVQVEREVAVRLSRRDFSAALGALATLTVARARAQRAREEIAVLDAPGVGPEALAAAIATIDASTTLRARVLTPAQVRAGGLASARAVLVTGGRGSRQGRALGEEGREAMRHFVREGGGYVGICAGSYLAM
ncbi:MAG: BPL-N domain-containing protein [Deltaproteobacteria bacterium]